ncbi:MAG: helix-turn-helix transcriptional regulator [Chloroflexi bacterium]|nr:helix-turn-helix transcriptional regulator [Chloroflexota bacterium]
MSKPESEKCSSLGTWIKNRRKELGWSQAQLAYKVGYSSKEAIRKIENDRYGAISPERVERLIEILGIPPTEQATFRAWARPASLPAGFTLGEKNSPIVPEVTRDLTTNTSHTSRTWRIALVGGLVMVLLVAATILALREHPISENGLVLLDGPSDRLIQVEANGRAILSGDHVKAGELVTVTFAVRNNDSRPVRINSLVIGARGPGAKEKGWSAPIVPFPGLSNILLKPGERVEYRQSQVFRQPGDYFVEPNAQDVLGNWGGIQPFTRIEFSVTD